MLNRSRAASHTPASLSWRLLFWLFAAFAGLEAPLGASELVRGKPVSISDGLNNGFSAFGVTSAEVSAPRHELADVALPDNSAEDSAPGPLEHAFRLALPAGSGLSAKLHIGSPAPAFQSRAPPALV